MRRSTHGPSRMKRIARNVRQARAVGEMHKGDIGGIRLDARAVIDLLATVEYPAGADEDPFADPRIAFRAKSAAWFRRTA